MIDKNEQEKFWSGDFGDHYIKRNSIENILPSKIYFFSKIFNHLGKIDSCLELGANVGANLLAINKIRPEIKLKGLEINDLAYESLENLGICTETFKTSLLNFKKKQIADLSFTMGVLIHISPNNLDKAYETLYLTSKKYLLLCEYYNPTPVAIDYRGHSNKLFKRDFAGELLNKYQDLELLEYGFSYKNDKKYSLDDINWFLLKKK
ncbi:pseudaminic acid biosynthesis-associated methylase [Alphaproteobacteria bacterium]|nr:pseudaminic acid biosynthesis-associated methylase [Alphaproteobacteria bacterium]